jgi:hypothetical protein
LGVAIVLMVAGTASAGELPLSFEANVGQFPLDVSFVARASDMAIAVSGGGLTLALPNRRVVKLHLAGAKPAAARGGDRLAGTANYFLGNDPSRWRTGVPTYSRVEVPGALEGVDVVYYGNRRHLEFDLEVAAGVEPRSLRLAVEGADRVKLDAQGNVAIRVGRSELKQLQPTVYQLVDGKRRPVPARLRLAEKAQLAFELGAYDRHRALVIDPVLIYSTYLGGEAAEFSDAGGNESPTGIAVDAAGNVFVAGSTTSLMFPTTAGALQTTSAGAFDIFVTKLNRLGTAAIFSTYVGGNQDNVASRMAVDAAGNVYVCGTTGPNFPITAGAAQPTHKAGDDGFIFKLNPAGSNLLYSTYLGGSTDEYLNGLALGPGGDVYVTGWTNSADYPVTAGAFQATAPGGGADAFVTRLNAAGTAWVYSTFLGGTTIDTGEAIAVDSAGNAFVTGSAGSTFPTTAGAAQTTHGGGNYDAYVTELNGAGSALVYSTFVGGNSDDIGFGITLDATGNAFVTGKTPSTTFPITAGALQTASAGPGSTDGFVAKLNPAGSAFVYSTYLGGTAADFARDVAVDGSGNATVAGYTNSTDFPVTAGALQTSNAGLNDAFIAQLNPTGTALNHASYLGGTGDDQGYRVAVDPFGAVYVAGVTASTALATTAGAFQTTYQGGTYDAFVAKVALLPAPTLSAVTPSSGPVAGGTGVTLTGTNFRAGATVDLGGVAATGVTVGSGTSITATTPAHALGAVDLTVTDPDGQSAKLTGEFTYVPNPTDGGSDAGASDAGGSADAGASDGGGGSDAGTGSDAGGTADGGTGGNEPLYFLGCGCDSAGLAPALLFAIGFLRRRRER